MEVLRFLEFFDASEDTGKITARVNSRKVVLYVDGIPVCSIDIEPHGFVSRQVGNMCINETRREIDVAGVIVATTKKEFDVLLAIVNTDGIAKRSFLHLQLFGGFGDKHIVDVHLSNARRKLVRAGWSCEITTLRGVGFRLEAP